MIPLYLLFLDVPHIDVHSLHKKKQKKKTEKNSWKGAFYACKDNHSDLFDFLLITLNYKLRHDKLHIPSPNALCY